MALKEGRVGVFKTAGWLLWHEESGTGAFLVVETTGCEAVEDVPEGGWALIGSLAQLTHFPSFPGRQLEQALAAFTQEQF